MVRILIQVPKLISIENIRQSNTNCQKLIGNFLIIKHQ